MSRGRESLELASEFLKKLEGKRPEVAIDAALWLAAMAIKGILQPKGPGSRPDLAHINPSTGASRDIRGGETKMANHPNRISALDKKLLSFAVFNRFFDAGDQHHCDAFPLHETALTRLCSRGLLEIVDVGGVRVYHATSAGERLASKNA